MARRNYPSSTELRSRLDATLRVISDDAASQGEKLRVLWGVLSDALLTIEELEGRTLPMLPLGPPPLTEYEERERAKELSAVIAAGVEKFRRQSHAAPTDEELTADGSWCPECGAPRESCQCQHDPAVPPVDRSCQMLASGAPVPDDRSHTKLRADGQQEGYVVLCESERKKGFVRPYRDAYRHVGPPGPRFQIHDLSEEQCERYSQCGYVKFEPYPESYKGSSTVGRYWTQEQLNRVGKGCGKITRMGRAIAETYARDPFFYAGTFCVHCGGHFPIGEDGEFAWYEMDGTTGPKVGT